MNRACYPINTQMNSNICNASIFTNSFNCSVKGDVAYLCERYVGGVGSVYNFIDGDQGYRIGFQSGKGIDQKHCKRTYAAEEDKVIHNSRNHNLYDRYIRIPAVEKS